jgi:ABC-type transport system substrate-binding protein
VTARDVKFTFDLAKDPETASLLGSAYMNLVREATVVDSRTVRFGFDTPHAQALDGFWWPPLPSHLLEGWPRRSSRSTPSTGSRWGAVPSASASGARPSR